jgi:ferritin-like metal-binding protein YciE
MDKLAYEESLKVYRDLKAVTDTANEDGYKEAESLLTSQLEEERRQKDTLIKTLSKTMSIAEMANLLGVPEDFIRYIVAE